ncbi:MAG: putative molybdenum cofactor guanylyltransferase [Phycisphaerae bacterium]|nr:putative molybdenum cofactor guanylyltransferase [Phycisphaerae bacterium]
MKRLPTYILAGGQSSRFGSDKARARLEGEPLIQRVVGQLTQVSESITVVAEVADKYGDLALRTIADIHPGLGPLSGLEAALSDLPHDQQWLLLCSCDGIVIRHQWLERLYEAMVADFAAVVFRNDHAQPLPGLYHRHCLSKVRARILTGKRSLHHLLDEIQTRFLPQPSDWPEFWQINTPDELEHFRQELDRRS